MLAEFTPLVERLLSDASRHNPVITDGDFNAFGENWNSRETNALVDFHFPMYNSSDKDWRG